MLIGDIDPLPQCWSNRFIFPPSNLLSQYFSVDMEIMRNKTDNFSGNMKKSILLEIVWEGSSDFNLETKKGTWSLIANSTTSREVHFAEGSATAEDIILFTTSSVNFVGINHPKLLSLFNI